MAKDNRPAVDFTTPRITFGFTRLNEPDPEYNKYSVQWRLKPEEFPEEVMARIVALRDELLESTKKALIAKGNGGKASKITVLPILRDEEDKQSGDPTGYVIVNPSLPGSVSPERGPNAGKTFTFRPEIYDSAGTLLKNPPRIFGGSVGCIHMLARPYYFAGKNELGVSWKLVGVQLLAVGERQGRSASAHGFKPQEGYVEGAEVPQREPGTDDAAEDDIPY